MANGASTEERPPGAAEGEKPPGSPAWSRRSQIAFVVIVMPVLVFLLVGTPYLLWHYFTYKLYIVIPPPLGGDRALEGHWTNAPSVPVQRIKLGAPRSAFGWVVADDDLVTNVFPTASGTVSQVYTGIGQAVARDAPLFAVTTRATGANPSPQEVVVNAPAAGTVTLFDVAVGQAVKSAKPGTAAPAVSIADLSSIWVEAEMDESDARSLRPEEEVEVRPTALAGRVFKGRVLTVSPGDADTRRATVRIVVENEDGSLKPNMLAAFTPAKADDVETLAVPESAVLFEIGSARVFVVREEQNSRGVSSTLSARTIRTGRIRGGMVEVLDGLKAGESVEASDALFIDRAAKGY